ncbi:ABC transporter permease [Chitinophaga lutea]
MIKNYIKVALRHLSRNKGITAINIAGLAIGMACCILIVLFIKDELSYDRFHRKGASIYRLTAAFHRESGVQYLYNTQFPAGPAMQRELSGVKEAVRIYFPEDLIIARGENAARQEDAVYADSGFFRIFSFPLLQGDPATVLKDPYSVVLTASTAKKYFGNENPVGKTLRVQDDFDCIVTGVAADPPGNTELGFQMVFSFRTFLQNSAKAGRNPESSWYGFSNLLTFLELEPGASPAAVEAGLPGLVEKYISKISKDIGETFTFHMQPLGNVHLKPEGDLAEAEGYSRLYIYGLIGLVIILIACFNFMNLVTARSQERAREVGMRKVMGALRRALVLQFLTESVIVCLLSFLGAIVLAQLLLPGFNYITDKQLGIFELQHLGLLAALFLLSVAVGLMAGLYPAVFLSGFMPARTLKGSATAGGKAALRKGLVIAQFSIAIALVIATAVIYAQLQYIQGKDLGFNKNGLINLYLDAGKQRPYKATFKQELERLPFVQSAAYNNMPMGSNFYSSNPVGLVGSPPNDNVMPTVMDADFSYFTNMGIRIVQGRDFNARFPTDSTDAFIINEAAVKAFGLKNALGARLEWRGSATPRQGTVIGVVEDFNYRDLRQKVGPLVVMMRPARANILVVRLAPGDRQAQLAKIGDIWKNQMPAFPFNYRFVETQLAETYERDHRVGQLFGAYACLAIFIACIGLFGLAMLIARQRMKEVGIRKVLGASVPGITLLLSKDFLQLVGVAIVVATPIAWYAMHRWLENFAFPVAMPWWTFIAAGAGAILIAFATISFQAVKTALSNPVRSLRSE